MFVTATLMNAVNFSFKINTNLLLFSRNSSSVGHAMDFCNWQLRFFHRLYYWCRFGYSWLVVGVVCFHCRSCFHSFDVGFYVFIFMTFFQGKLYLINFCALLADGSNSSYWSCLVCIWLTRLENSCVFLLILSLILS